MAHYVEPHFNPTTGCHVPGYWNPDYNALDVAVLPCATREEAEAYELEADAGIPRDAPAGFLG